MRIIRSLVFFISILASSCKHNAQFIEEVDRGLEKAQDKHQNQQGRIEGGYEELNQSIDECVDYWGNFEIRLGGISDELKKKFMAELLKNLEISDIAKLSSNSGLRQEYIIQSLLKINHIVDELIAEFDEQRQKLEELLKSIGECQIR